MHLNPNPQIEIFNAPLRRHLDNTKVFFSISREYHGAVRLCSFLMLVFRNIPMPMAYLSSSQVKGKLVVVLLIHLY